MCRDDLFIGSEWAFSELWEAGGYAWTQDDLSFRIRDFYCWLLTLRDRPEYRFIDSISRTASTRSSHVGCQFTCHFDKKLPCPTTRSGFRLTGHHDLSRLNRLTIPGWVVGKLI